MRFRNLDLNLLVQLDALLAEKSVSKAAKRVFLSQSAMSDALARMRDFFHDDLLVRVGRAMAPTPLAQSLQQPVRDVLIQIRSIASSTADFDPANSNRKITMLTSDYMVDVLLKKVIPVAAQQAPGIQFEFAPFTSNFREEFARGHLDLMIIPEGYTSEDHPSETLYQESWTCVVWSKNTSVGKKISFEQYKKMGHVCVNLGEWRVPTYEEWFLKRYGNIRRIEIVVPSFNMALQLVSGTQRIATCHLRHALMYAKQYSLRMVAPPFDIPPLKERVQWHKYMDRDPALVWFRGLLKSTAVKV
ncbi:MAG: LysR family transcriptional regulator [Candidatus Korobacteraceae bacterium]